MNHEHSDPAPAELASAYWIDSPVMQQHGLCNCPFEEQVPRARPSIWRTVMIGTACALIVTALGMVVI